MGMFTRNKKKHAKLSSPSRRLNISVVKVVHPEGYAEVFWKPIRANDILQRYPRYCITRPDVFEYPWIVVNPESMLVPGKVYLLLPKATLDKLIKAKTRQLESMNLSSSGQCNQAGLGTHNGESSSCDHGRQGQGFDTNSPYRRSFYRTWNRMRENLESQSDQESFGLGLDSPLNSCRSSFSSWTRGNRGYETSADRFNSELKPCLRKPDGDRRNLNLRVSFAPYVVIPGSPKMSPSSQRGSPSSRRMI